MAKRHYHYHRCEVAEKPEIGFWGIFGLFLKITLFIIVGAVQVAWWLVKKSYSAVAWVITFSKVKSSERAVRQTAKDEAESLAADRLLAEVPAAEDTIKPVLKPMAKAKSEAKPAAPRCGHCDELAIGRLNSPSGTSMKLCSKHIQRMGKEPGWSKMSL